MNIKKGILIGILFLIAIFVVNAQVECHNADVMIVLDASSSMIGDPINNAKNAASNFVDYLDDEDHIGVVKYGNQSYLEQGLTEDKNLVKNKISGRADINHVIVLLSDGVPNRPTPGTAVIYAKDAATAAKDKGTIIFSIAIGTADVELMGELASTPNPPFLSTGTSEDLDDIYAEIATRLCEGPFCGDGELDEDLGEQCDDGNNDNGDGCSSTCQIESTRYCGDGILDEDLGEECDDGNNNDGDGCSANCQIEENGDEEIPEFSTIGAGLVLVAVGMFIFYKRRK